MADELTASVARRLLGRAQFTDPTGPYLDLGLQESPSETPDPDVVKYGVDRAKKYVSNAVNSVGAAGASALDPFGVPSAVVGLVSPQTRDAWRNYQSSQGVVPQIAGGMIGGGAALGLMLKGARSVRGAAIGAGTAAASDVIDQAGGKNGAVDHKTVVKALLGGAGALPAKALVGLGAAGGAALGVNAATADTANASGLPGWMDGRKVKSRDEYLSDWDQKPGNARPVEKTLQEFQKNAVDEYRSSPAYKKLIDMNAASKAEANAQAHAATRAKELFTSQGATFKTQIADYEKRRGDAYGDYATDEKRIAQMPFAETNLGKNWPAVQMVAGLLAGGLAKGAHLGFQNRLPKATEKAVGKFEKARASGSIDDQIFYAQKVDGLRAEAARKAGEAPQGLMAKAGASFKDSAIPTVAGGVAGMEAQVYPYQYDKQNADNTPIEPGKPGTSSQRAYKTAMERTGDPVSQITSAAAGFVPGALGGNTASHLMQAFKRRMPMGEANAVSTMVGGGKADPVSTADAAQAYGKYKGDVSTIGAELREHAASAAQREAVAARQSTIADAMSEAAIREAGAVKLSAPQKKEVQSRIAQALLGRPSEHQLPAPVFSGNQTSQTPVKSPRKSPTNASTNQELIIPDGIKPNQNWQQHSDNARAAVLKGLDDGLHLANSGKGRITAQDVYGNLKDPDFSVKNVQARLSDLRKVMESNGLDPARATKKQGSDFLARLDPRIFSVPAAIGATGAYGLSADDGPGSSSRDVVRQLMGH